MIRFGALKPARLALTRAMSAASSTCWPGYGSTRAVIASPKRSSGTPTTAASATVGSDLRTVSTSSGYTFSPPVLMHSLPRPRRCTVPSASTVAKSPGIV